MLAEPANRHLITKIKTAITVGIRPMAMIFHEQPGAPWEPFDFILLEAYQRLQDELCPKCGHPVWLCRSSSNAVQFKVQSAYCAGERALREAEDRAKSKSEKKASAAEKRAWGEFKYTVPYAPPGMELPTRSEYYEELASKVE